MNPGSAVRYTSVARHVTDCAKRPGGFILQVVDENHVGPDQLASIEAS